MQQCSIGFVFYRFDHGSRQEKYDPLDLVMVNRILTQHFDTEYDSTQAV